MDKTLGKYDLIFCIAKICFSRTENYIQKFDVLLSEKSNLKRNEKILGPYSRLFEMTAIFVIWGRLKDWNSKYRIHLF